MTAGVLAVGFGGFVARFDGIAAGLVVAAVVATPFAAYAVWADDEPTTVLAPRVVGLAGVGVALATPIAFVDGRSTDGVATGVLAGVVLAVFPLAYAARYGTGGPPARPTAALGVAVGGLVSLAAVVGGVPAAVAVGVVVGLGSAEYARLRGLHVSPRACRRSVFVGLAVGVGTIAAGVAGVVPMAGALVGGVGFSLAPAVFYAAVLDPTAIG